MQGFSFAFTVTLCLQKICRLSERRFGGVVLAAQPRHLGAMGQGSRVGFEGCGGKGISDRCQTAKRARRDPFFAALSDQSRRAIELLGREKMTHRLLPNAALDEILGATQMFRRHTGAPNLSAEASP